MPATTSTGVLCRRLVINRRVKDGDTLESAVVLGEVETVANDELVRDVEADHGHLDVNLGCVWLAQEGNDFNRGSAAGFKV
jgi:hypothetical protein